MLKIVAENRSPAVYEDIFAGLLTLERIPVRSLTVVVTQGSVAALEGTPPRGIPSSRK